MPAPFLYGLCNFADLSLAHRFEPMKCCPFPGIGPGGFSGALIGVDTCPMEGIDRAKYDEVLGLDGTDFTTVVACPVGYRAADDKYAMAPKVRFKTADVVEHI
ncbi:MAG: hypothetical protein NTZ29_16015 [Verrucomicrobia bacterium]|nr:hypothetical protein [Verrucomicrobiota bacterium]